MTNRVGSTLDGRYEIRERVAGGGFGTVYRAADLNLGRDVAIKLLRDEFINTGTIRERFRREAQNLSLISDRNVVQVLDFNGDNMPPYIVMEFVEGSNLRELISRALDWTIEDRVGFFSEILDGLSAIHARGIAHRDLKPENVLVDRESHTPKITDFGIAQASRDARLTRTGEVPGTPAYMAPERWSSDADGASYASDIYSAGVILYELLTGTVPFNGDYAEVVHARLTRNPVAPRALNPEIPEELERAVLKCLEMDPADRYQSAAEMKTAINGSLLRPQPPAIAPETPTREMVEMRAGSSDESPGPRRRRGRVTLAAMPFVFAIVVLALLQLSQLDDRGEFVPADDPDDTPPETHQTISDEGSGDGIEQVSQVVFGGQPDYAETGPGESMRWELDISPGMVAIVGGYEVGSETGGVYRAISGPAWMSVDVTDGFFVITERDAARSEWCTRIDQAEQFDWAVTHRHPLPEWGPCDLETHDAALVGNDGCPRAADVERLAGVDLRPIDEPCGFASSDATSPTIARCPAEFICTIAVPDDRVVVTSRETQFQNAIVGTWRYIDAYPPGDAVHQPCRLLQKEREHTPLQVVPAGFACTES